MCMMHVIRWSAPSTKRSRWSREEAGVRRKSSSSIFLLLIFTHTTNTSAVIGKKEDQAAEKRKRTQEELLAAYVHIHIVLIIRRVCVQKSLVAAAAAAAVMGRKEAKRQSQQQRATIVIIHYHRTRSRCLSRSPSSITLVEVQRERVLNAFLNGSRALAANGELVGATAKFKDLPVGVVRVEFVVRLSGRRVACERNDNHCDLRWLWKRCCHCCYCFSGFSSLGWARKQFRHLLTMPTLTTTMNTTTTNVTKMMGSSN